MKISSMLTSKYTNRQIQKVYMTKQPTTVNLKNGLTYTVVLLTIEQHLFKEFLIDVDFVGLSG